MRCLTRGQRGLVLWTARVALIVISFQMAALDHHVNFADVTGVEGSSEHVMHCHGATSSCSDAGAGAIATAADAYLLPLPGPAARGAGRTTR